MKYEVWQREGRFGEQGAYRGHEYEEERLGIFLQIAMGLESQGAVGAYREKYYLFYVSDEGRVGYIPTNQGQLKPLD
jgi:hypothetical protein